MNEKMKKAGKKIGSALLTLAIVLFFRHVVLKDSREEEQKSYYISTISSYESRRGLVEKKHKDILKIKEKMTKEKKDTNEYNLLLGQLEIDETNIKSYVSEFQSYVRELRYYEEKFPELEPVKIENEKEILNGTYLDPEYYKKEK